MGKNHLGYVCDKFEEVCPFYLHVLDFFYVLGLCLYVLDLKSHVNFVYMYTQNLRRNVSYVCMCFLKWGDMLVLCIRVYVCATFEEMC